jgi:hypothetical protein
MTGRIVRLRPEDRLTAIGGIDRSPPAATVRPDHYTIPAIIVRLGSQRLSLDGPANWQIWRYGNVSLLVRPNGKPCRKGRGRYSPGQGKGRVPTARRQAAEIIRLKESGIRPSETASRLGIGRPSGYLGPQSCLKCTVISDHRG